MPPSNPVMPQVRRRAWLAQSMAHSTFSLLPLPLKTISMSSAVARFLSCSTKTRSKPSSLAQARMAGRVVGEAEDLQAFAQPLS